LCSPSSGFLALADARHLAACSGETPPAGLHSPE